VLYADFSKQVLDEALELARQEGLQVEGHLVDISNRQSLEDVARAAQAIGRISAVVTTAALMPGYASTAEDILRVNIVGTPNIIDVFVDYAEEETSMVCVASVVGRLPSISKRLEHHFATAATDRLLDHPELDPLPLDAGAAYALGKRANHLRVQASPNLWGSKGARLNSISPGLITTAAGNHGINNVPRIKEGVEGSALRRPSLPVEAAKVIGFLMGPGASFVIGSDILADGWTLSGLR
jgi:NAD(P)-dependent dehydrogenase (short-subunit alcohol dehydrogenase family)